MKLTVFKDSQELQSVDLKKEIGASDAKMSFLMGRSSQCHVVLDSPLVSRELAELTHNQNIWTIKRSSEFNPLIINGGSVTEKVLASGDMITCGPFVVSVEVDMPVAIEKPKVTALNTLPSDEEESEVGATETLALDEDEATQALEAPLDELSDDALEEASDELINDDMDSGFGDDGLIEQADETLDESDEFEVEAQEMTEAEFEAGDEAAFDEGGFGEEGALDVLDDDDYEDNDSTRVLNAFASYSLELFGEYAPYDRYKIDKGEIRIGRDPSKCDIVLPDPEVSGVHAIVRKLGSDLHIEDLQSGNGTLLNGERVNKAEIHNGDEFLIGSTTFTVKITSDLLKQEEGRLMPVDLNQEIEVEEIVEVDPDSDEADSIEGDSFGESSGPASNSLFTKEALKDPVKRKKILYILVGLLAVWVLLDDEQPEAPKPKAETAEVKATPSAAEVNAQKQANDAFSKLSAEEKKFIENNYVLAKALFDQGKYNEALLELEKIFSLVPDYKNARQIEELAKQGLAKLEELARKEQQEKERKERMAKVNDLATKAKEATKERNKIVAEALFGEILRLDPENYDVPQMRLELEAWQKEQDRIKLEKATAEAERKRMVDALAASKSAFLADDWYRAIGELEKFLEIKTMDEDLVKEATDMLKKSKSELEKQVSPLLGKARSLKEGQDLKGAYEQYKQILKFNPTQLEALNEMDAIREELFRRSQRVYREAIIAESLSLFDSAKEKFQEVQQISPTDSEYYQKATDKLKNYIY
ncbi:MAG: hypothetical protein CME71_09600 [Halobacteriovorax sp.]|nr:hypothetical protein [Halobacteriovorax sp.]